MNILQQLEQIRSDYESPARPGFITFENRFGDPVDLSAFDFDRFDPVPFATYFSHGEPLYAIWNGALVDDNFTSPPIQIVNVVQQPGVYIAIKSWAFQDELEQTRIGGDEDNLPTLMDKIRADATLDDTMAYEATDTLDTNGTYILNCLEDSEITLYKLYRIQI